MLAATYPGVGEGKDFSYLSRLALKGLKDSIALIPGGTALKMRGPLDEKELWIRVLALANFDFPMALVHVSPLHLEHLNPVPMQSGTRPLFMFQIMMMVYPSRLL